MAGYLSLIIMVSDYYYGEQEVGFIDFSDSANPLTGRSASCSFQKFLSDTTNFHIDNKYILGIYSGQMA